MSRIRVVADDGWLALDEHIGADQAADEHYRRCLADRIWWAVQDAEARSPVTGRDAVGEPPVVVQFPHALERLTA